MAARRTAREWAQLIREFEGSGATVASFARRLRWYTTFRSLIASCALQGLNAQLYIEELLRLAPHWPKNRVLELSPKYWPATREQLDARQRAIITRPWEHEPPTMITVPSRAPPPSANPVLVALRRAG